jgi:hypothetical protein
VAALVAGFVDLGAAQEVGVGRVVEEKRLDRAWVVGVEGGAQLGLDSLLGQRPAERIVSRPILRCATQMGEQLSERLGRIAHGGFRLRAPRR